MAPRPNALPPHRCTAYAVTTRKVCGNWAVPGATVCRLHGGNAPQVREKGVDRLALAELMMQDPRPPWEVLRDALHLADALLREAKLKHESGEPLPSNWYERLDQAIDRSARLSKIAISLKVYERNAHTYERRVGGELIGQVLGRIIDVIASDERTRTWAFETAKTLLLADGPIDRVELPALPPAGSATVPKT